MRIIKYIIFNYKKIYIFPFWFILFLFSLLYCVIISLQRKRGYKNKYPGVFIISVGNLTVGGTGKTEVVKYLSELMSPENKTAIILRGYKSINVKPVVVNKNSIVDEVGDEALLHFKRTKSLVIVSRKRREGVELAKQHGCRYIILDDAFQHWDLDRDLNIVLIDFTNPFGNNCLLPAGILREPLSSLNHADVIIITKYNGNKIQLKNLEKQIRLYNHQSPIFISKYTLGHIAQNNKKIDLKAIINRKIILFSGIGNIGYFMFLVKQHLKPREIKIIQYPDHYHYNKKDIDYLKETLNQGYDYLVTTEKDSVKVMSFRIYPLIFCIEIEINNKVKFHHLINKTIYC